MESHSKVAIGYTAMTLTLTGTAMQALWPAGLRYSYPLFLVSGITWLVNGIITRNRPLVAMQAVLAVLNVIAVVRWFT